MEQSKFSFKSLHENRKWFIRANKNNDHVVLLGSNNILISAPHGVSQIRLGKLKVAEIGALATALQIKNSTDCFFIAKTANNNDDANFDEHSAYKNSIRQLIKNNNIKYVIDIHGLGAHRTCDINFGTHLGKNIESNNKAFELLNKSLTASGFSVSIDQPFMAGHNTISGSIKNEFPQVWTLQIEINCSITNKPENFTRYKKLICVLTEWVNKINK